MMFGDVANRLLDIMGKRVEKQGIVTVEQLPEAIARLKRAAAENKAEQTHRDEEDKEDETHDRRPGIGLAQRAVPLIDMLERSLKANVPVTWGV
jgi:ABC-type Zn2+ transport system substrate-binding protein/surface adhesin